MLAIRYSDDKKRGKAMTYALVGSTFGLLIGAPFGGLVYQLTDKSTPFLIICCVTAFLGCK